MNRRIKYNEIQLRFVDGVGFLIKKHESNHLNTTVEAGLMKLWKLKETYEQQLEDAGDDNKRISDIFVCFRCFDKPDGECHDCD